MKIAVLSFMLFLLCISCKETKELNVDNSNLPSITVMESDEYLIFGTYAGSCLGDCVDMFKLTKDALYKETSKERPFQDGFYEGEYKKLPAIDHKRVSILLAGANPLEGKKTGETFGCPDCADQGGIYIEYGKGEKKIKGYLDTNMDALPEELRENASMIMGLVSLLSEK